MAEWAVLWLIRHRVWEPHSVSYVGFVTITGNHLEEWLYLTIGRFSQNELIGHDAVGFFNAVGF